MLSVVGLVKSFQRSKGEADERVLAIDGVNLEVREGDFFTLLGPSGCGKTTTLRCIAGLEWPDSGTIRVDGRTFVGGPDGARVPANKRQLGMVFQSYAIWPHMKVYDNVAFPLQVMPRRERPSKTQIRERVERALATVHLDGLETRDATDLSGGQQQRLALARGLVLEPKVLLLDEPLSNLDAKLRESMRFELKRMQRDLGLTAIYVTHDQAEALAMSTVVGVMNAGRLEQVASPREVYEKPASRFVADFIGSTNLIHGTVIGFAHGFCDVSTKGGLLRAPAKDQEVPIGTEVLLSVRPEHMDITSDSDISVGAGRWSGMVTTRAFLGEAVDHLVDVAGLELRVRTGASKSIAPGTGVVLAIQESSVVLLPSN